MWSSAYAVIICICRNHYICMSRSHQHMTWSNELCWCSSWILLLMPIALGHLLKWRHDIISWRWHDIMTSQSHGLSIWCHVISDTSTRYTFSSNLWLHINSNALHTWLIWRGVQLHPDTLSVGQGSDSFCGLNIITAFEGFERYFESQYCISVHQFRKFNITQEFDNCGFLDVTRF